MSQDAVICRKYMLFLTTPLQKFHSGVPNPLAHGLLFEDQLPTPVDHQIFDGPKMFNEILGCASRNASGSHLVLRGVFVPGRHDADNSTNWIGQSRSRLALRRSEKPATKAGQIRALWPEIAAALEAGQSLKSIRQWLEEDAGIAVGVTSLTSYISRIRRRESGTQRAQNSPPPEPLAVDSSVPAGAQTLRTPADSTRQLAPLSNADPIAQAMRALAKPRLDIRKLHNDGDPTGKSLI